MKPALTKKELALLMEAINPLRDSDYWSAMKSNGFSKLLTENGIRTEAQADRIIDKAYEKLRKEFLKRQPRKVKRAKGLITEEEVPDLDTFEWEWSDNSEEI